MNTLRVTRQSHIKDSGIVAGVPPVLRDHSNRSPQGAASAQVRWDCGGEGEKQYQRARPGSSCLSLFLGASRMTGTL